MRNVYRREQWNRKDQIYQSDAYCPSIENALFKQHKLQQLLAQNQLKNLGLQKAQALIKALYEQVKRLEMQNFEYRSEMQEMFREYAQKQKQLKKEIHFLRHKNNSVSQQRERKFSQSKEYLSNMLMPDVSRRLSVIPQSFNSKSLNQACKNRGTSPIQKMKIIQTVSKQYVDMRDCGENISKQLYEQARDYFLSQQLQKVLVDFEDMADVIRVQREQLNFYKDQHVQNCIQVQQLSKQFNTNKNTSNTTSTKPNYSTHTQKYTDEGNNNDISIINRRLIIKGKRLFSTQNDNNNTETMLATQRVQFSPYGQGKVNNYVNMNKKCQQNNKKQQYALTYTQVIKEYEHIIQQYKEYSAYLKAYLCSCIGFISKQTDESLQLTNKDQKSQQHEKSKQSNKKNDLPLKQQTSKNLLEFPSKKIFNVVLNNVLQSVKQKVQFQHEIRKQVQKENQQLRFILDQLINNLKLTGFPGLAVMNDKRYSHHQRNQNDQVIRNNEKNINKKTRTNGERSSRTKVDHKININKPIIHRMTITEANNYYHPVK